MSYNTYLYPYPIYSYFEYIFVKEDYRNVYIQPIDGDVEYIINGSNIILFEPLQSKYFTPDGKEIKYGILSEDNNKKIVTYYSHDIKSDVIAQS